MPPGRILTRDDYADPQPDRASRASSSANFSACRRADGYAEGMITETEAYGGTEGRGLPRLRQSAHGADGNHVRAGRRGLRLFLLRHAPDVQYRHRAAGFARRRCWSARCGSPPDTTWCASAARACAEKDWASGPGRVCAALGIEMHHNRHDLLIGEKIWIEDRGVNVPPREVKRTPRIGVDYAGIWALKPWRFVWVPGPR